MKVMGLVLMAVALALSSASSAVPRAAAAAGYYQKIPRANCGPGSSPETGFQGQVPLVDRLSGRSQLGYWCNLQLVGQSQGEGASWQNTWYGNCDYYDTADNQGTAGVGAQQHLGAVVLDVSDPAHPNPTTYLASNGMLHAWESLKVNEPRALLAGHFNGNPWLDIYDVSGDCSHPRLLSSTAMPNNGHEGDWSPDGMTYWGSSTSEYHPIDVSDPAHPKQILSWPGPTGHTHGLSISDDGMRAYFTVLGFGTGGSSGANGLVIADVSDIQLRRPNPQIRTISYVTWPEATDAQHTIPITIGGKPYLVFVDESGAGWIGSTAGWTYACGAGLLPFGVARIFDISDEAHPKLVSRLTLDTNDPANCASVIADTSGQVIFGYDSHYCSVDRKHDATAMACGYFNSGIRVFDIRDPANPREIAYFNPPAQPIKGATGLYGSEHAHGGIGASALTADWCSSQSRFVQAADGTWMLWAQCQDNGFMTLRFTNGAYPLAGTAGASAGQSTNPAASGAAASAPLPFSAGPARERRLAPIALLAAGLLLTAGAALSARRRRRREAGP